MKNFALIGAAGFVAPRHLQAIRDTGNHLVAAVDSNDSAGVLDSYFPEAKFFTEIERFDRFLEKLRRGPEENRVEYVSICSPNYLHDAHVRLALRVRAHAICEKPLVLSPWNIDALVELEQEFGCEIYTILQLRLIDKLQELKAKFDAAPSQKVDVDLSYITSRGPWYFVSWKGSREKSGGVAMNVGIHFFDLLLWLFGACENVEVHLNEKNKVAGRFELEKARVNWFLSLDREDLPQEVKSEGKSAYRCLSVDGEEIEFSSTFADLHTKSYAEILSGRGFRATDAYPSISLVHEVSKSVVVGASPGQHHPFLTGA